jgi:hypothetical protein
VHVCYIWVEAGAAKSQLCCFHFESFPFYELGATGGCNQLCILCILGRSSLALNEPQFVSLGSVSSKASGYTPNVQDNGWSSTLSSALVVQK